MSTINFGQIGGRRMITFDVTNSGRVPRPCDDPDDLFYSDNWISDHEAFRRWKIARKAWKTRKARQQQQELGL